MDLEELLDVVSHPAAPIALSCYFARWAGRRFQSLGVIDDLNVDRDLVTATDIAAVQLLGVVVPPHRIIDLLEGDLGRKLSLHLREIPTDVDLGTRDAKAYVGKGGHAYQAWHLLNGADSTGIGWVTAGKLLARKRPRLIPVYDSVVRCVLAPPRDRFWLWLDEQLQAKDGCLKHRLAKLHTAAALPRTVSVIRVLDVVVWMLHQKEHRSLTCSGFNLSSVPANPDCATWQRTPLGTLGGLGNA